MRCVVSVERNNTMTQQNHDTGDNNKKQQGSGHVGEPASKIEKEPSGRPDKGGTAGQSGGDQVKNRSSDPKSVRE
jgi:hypothetical protein